MRCYELLKHTTTHKAQGETVHEDFAVLQPYQEQENQSKFHLIMYMSKLIKI
jgi:hypothetical protein